MNKPLSLALASLFFALTTLTASPPAPTPGSEVTQSVRERLVGAWRLAWLEEEGADGNVHRADCTGLLVKDLTRAYELSGNRLIVKAANPAERWRVAWERYDGEPRGGE
jgi:hypothetical protein